MTKAKATNKNKELPAEMETRQSRRINKNKFVKIQGRHSYTQKEKEEALANGGIITGDHSDGTSTIAYPQDEDDFEDYNAADYDYQDDYQRDEDEEEEIRQEAIQRKAANAAARVAARSS
jgi:hypothetical protein